MTRDTLPRRDSGLRHVSSSLEALLIDLGAPAWVLEEFRRGRPLKPPPPRRPPHPLRQGPRAPQRRRRPQRLPERRAA